MSNLTQVGSGGVTRPDVALKDDLNQVTEVANDAAGQAKSTAELLETRVPVGRTINNLPLNEDILLTTEDLNTYDKETIDQKINAVASTGYNPVHVNGKLLDRDIILSAGDIGAYSSQEVDDKVSDLVPETRMVNGKPLDADITLGASDVNAYTKTETDNKLNGYVPTTRKVNNVALDGDITLTPADIGSPKTEDVVPRSFKINGQPLTGDSLDIAGGDSYSRTEVDNKLNQYMPLLNDFGLGMTPQLITAGTLLESAQGSGFYAYAQGDDLDADGNPITTNMTDRPAGSTSGKIIVMATGGDSNVLCALAFPDDLDGVYFRKDSTWEKIPQAADLSSYLKLDSKGRVSSLLLKSGVALTAELSEDAVPVNVLAASTTSVDVGVVSSPLHLQSSQDPTVSQAGVSYKLVTEKNAGELLPVVKQVLTTAVLNPLTADKGVYFLEVGAILQNGPTTGISKMYQARVEVFVTGKSVRLTAYCEFSDAPTNRFGTWELIGGATPSWSLTSGLPSNVTATTTWTLVDPS